MAKTSGLGDNLYVAGYDLSGDVGSIQRIAGGPTPLEVTAINKSAVERIGGVRDGGIDFSTWINFVTEAEHEALSALPYSDVLVTYFRGEALGGPAAACVAKQINYDWTRGDDGALSGTVQAQANGYGLEWGQQLTAGPVSHTGAANGTALDGGASSSFGLQAYLHVFSFTGTDATVKLQGDDNSGFTSSTDVSNGGFTQITAAPFSQRIATPNNQTIERYLRVSSVTTGGFSEMTFAVMVVRNSFAVVF